MASAVRGRVEDRAHLCEELEKQELDAPGGIASGPVYLKLLTLYLLKNDLCNAKYLWKRIPQSVKLSTPELGLVWNVGQRMWQRDFAAIYQALNQEWSDNISQMMQALLETVRERAMHLVSHAYSSIGYEDFSGFVGLPIDQAIQLAQQHGWSIDSHSSIVTPVKSGSRLVQGTPSEEQLIKLTDFVSFLEN